MALMLKKLQIEKSKVPSPSREQMIEMLFGAWKETDKGFNAIIKELFVTNAFDGPEDFLVSDKLFSLIGDDMLEYRRQLLKSEVPVNLQTVVKKLIPPKGIRCKNIEESELLHYTEGEPTIDDLEPAEKSENDEQFSSKKESDQENVDPDQDKDVPINTPVSGKRSLISSLQNIFNDPEVNKDAKFLDNFQKYLKII